MVKVFKIYISLFFYIFHNVLTQAKTMLEKNTCLEGSDVDYEHNKLALKKLTQ